MEIYNDLKELLIEDFDCNTSDITMTQSFSSLHLGKDDVNYLQRKMIDVYDLDYSYNELMFPTTVAEFVRSFEQLKF
jgi:hypothetical protein